MGEGIAGTAPGGSPDASVWLVADALRLPDSAVHRMEFRVLGPVEVFDGDRPVAISMARLRTLLAALLLRPNQPLTFEELIDAVWGESLPANPRAALQTSVSRLRRLLPGDRDRIVTREYGYQFLVDDDEVDLLRFRQYVARADAEADASARVPLLTSALELWRGEPLGGLPAGPLTRDHLTQLVEERLQATEQLLGDRLQLGDHAEVVAELGVMVRQHPERERLWTLLITALYRSGRQADALAAYQRMHAYLRDHLGLQPRAELRALHHAVLTHDPALDGGHRDDAGPPDARLPRELPADLERFVGRADALAALDRILPADPSEPADHLRPIVIAALDGTAGVGKTALAVHWAHRVSDRFADGQLYLNLRGYGPTGPMPPAEAVEVMLRSLGTPVDQIPLGLDNRSALLRTVLSGKRMLVVLDNARDADQVRPLLPGSGSLVLITSRSQLRGLAVREGAHRITLDQLSAAESTELLRRTIGERADAEPDAVSELARRCGRLPLALALAAERATREPARPLSELVGDLRDEWHRLDALGGDDDPGSDLRVVFSWSYRTLPEDAARVFRLLGIAPGPDIAAPASAALAGLDVAATQRILDRLVRANLVQSRRPGRYEIHDLLRSYAVELARRLEPADVRRTAVHRLLRWYLRSALNARFQLQPSETTVRVVPGRDQVAPLSPRTGADALSWYIAEADNLASAVRMAHDEQFDDLCWRLAYALWIHLQSFRAWEAILDTQDLGLQAARRDRDRSGEAHMLNGMGVALRGAGLSRDAVRRQRAALELFRTAGDSNGEATALSNLGISYRALGDHERALECSRQALALDRRHAEPGNTAISLMQIARTLTAIGEAGEAISAATEGLALMRSVGHRRGEARALQALADAHAELGDHGPAIARCTEATEIYIGLDDRWAHAAALVQLGHLQDAGQLPAAARESWRQALAILDELGAPDTADLRDRVGHEPTAS